MLTQQKKHSFSEDIKIFGNTKVLVISALFVAMSIVLGKFLAFNITNSIRISFENLSILMSGIIFGPIVGMVTAIVADIIGCILYGYAINPIITLGAASIGFISGFVSHFFFKKSIFVNTLMSVAISHFIGSVLIKSLGLYVYFHTPFQILLFRIPTYIIISAAEFYLIYMLMQNKALNHQLQKVFKK